MNRQTTLGRWCAYIIEACYLLALTLIPLYFNLFSARHFEPDKATTLRALVLIAAAAGLVWAIDALNERVGNEAGQPSEQNAPAEGPGFWGRFAAIPLAVPTLAYAAVFLLTTITSVVPLTSFWGSYQRLQGTYTNLSYMLLFVLMAVTIRSRAQLERAITLILAAGTTAAAYGVLQHLQLDPLPWQGDVIARVASTMGNSIFIAAYLIMLVPLALYRLVGAINELRAAPPTQSPANEWLWTVARGFLLLSGMLLLLMVIKFGTAVRTIDFRYWWVLPGAVMVATALWWLLSTDFDRSGKRIPLWPGFVLLGYLLLFGAQFALTAAGNIQQIVDASVAPNAVDWWLWLLISLFSALIGYGMALSLPTRGSTPSRLSWQITTGGAGISALLLILAIFFTQSRGPWLGLAAGLFVFCSLLLWLGWRRALAQQATVLASRLRIALFSWIGLTLAVGGFLVAFNLSNAPFFQQLREVPYIGRMGQLLEVDEGTGLVRRLIWSGDQYGGGAIALISSNPLRALIGWGPESMFVAFNPFFPPSLANVEARGASPDRSHQAILDELVTKGFLGLASYLFVLISFAALAWRLARRSDEWRWQVFFVAMLSIIVCNVVEGLTGIPIVSTLMMFWATLALTLVGGKLAGHYSLRLSPEPAPAPEPAAPAPTARNSGGRRKDARPANQRQPRARSQARRNALNPAAIASYTALVAVALLLTWWANLNLVYADMRFQQGQSLNDQAGLDLDLLAQVLDDYLTTVDSNPREDFYYLNLGRTLMTLSESLRLRGVELGEPLPNANIDDLLRLRGYTQIAGFIERTSPMGLLSYAEAVLLRAHDLNPLSKDHFANLGRLHSYWFNLTGDPSHLQTALDWYTRVSPLAPNDVILVNERAGILMQLGDYATAAGNAALADSSYAQADELLSHSLTLDPKYADTYVRQGNLIRSRTGDLDTATASYVSAIGISANAVSTSIEQIIVGMESRPDLILRLRDAFVAQTEVQEQALAVAEGQPERRNDLPTLRSRLALLHSINGLLSVRAGDVSESLPSYARAAELQPTSLEYSRNYTIVLSDTQRYDEAIAETNRIIGRLRSANRTSELSQAEQLLQIVEQARP